MKKGTSVYITAIGGSRNGNKCLPISTELTVRKSESTLPSVSFLESIEPFREAVGDATVGVTE